jgi:hypothetical protein
MSYCACMVCEDVNHYRLVGYTASNGFVSSGQVSTIFDRSPHDRVCNYLVTMVVGPSEIVLTRGNDFVDVHKRLNEILWAKLEIK